MAAVLLQGLSVIVTGVATLAVAAIARAIEKRALRKSGKLKD